MTRLAVSELPCTGRTPRAAPLHFSCFAARAWCQAAQKFTGGIGTKLCALLYGDAEKPMETGAKEDPGSEEKRPACTCNSKPCSCPKADVNYAFLHSTDLLPACHGEVATMSFLQDVVDILLQYVAKSFDRSTKVIDFHYPNELLQEYNWELADQPQTLEEILLNCRTTLKYAIKTGNGPPRFPPAAAVIRRPAAARGPALRVAGARGQAAEPRGASRASPLPPPPHAGGTGL
ncbi:PREDICTED: glutamate decarboxylase 2-like [Gavialis gangeticus]|uniref:glutamate decarboxylase 2-like n=1 Tax=Gavialis gangeticus TaxID=94835 RepID=UPI00092EBD5E|nr:PREDICTED: glutamate decarboxylase 2-like [Gavialis gangeticus]